MPEAQHIQQRVRKMVWRLGQTVHENKPAEGGVLFQPAEEDERGRRTEGNNCKLP